MLVRMVVPWAAILLATFFSGCGTPFGGKAKVLLDSDPPGATAYLIPTAEFDTEKRKSVGDLTAVTNEGFLAICDEKWLDKYRKGDTPFEGLVSDWNYIYAVRRGESIVGCQGVSVRVRAKNHFILRDKDTSPVKSDDAKR